MRHAPLRHAERNHEPGPRSCDFPRHSGHDHYQSRQMPAYLLHGLAELALLAEDRDPNVLTPDRSAR